MKEIEVVVQPDGKEAKEVNPFACYGDKEPHPMDFDDRDEFYYRHHQWEQAEGKLKTFEIVSLKNTAGQVLLTKRFNLTNIAGTKQKAELFKNDTVQILLK